MEAKTNNLEQYLSIDIVSQKLNVSKGTIYNLIKAKKLSKCNITPDITRLKASEVQEYMDNNTR